MQDSMFKKSLIIGITVLLILSSFLPSIPGKFLTGKKNNDTSINIDHGDKETEYWGVSIIGFIDPFTQDYITPVIYDALLESENWDESHLILLFRENATRDAILDSLDWLIENADENDIVFFHDNSHGTRDNNGEYGIVPVDAMENGIITVDELDEKFDAIKAKELCLIFDCCLSGSFVKRTTIQNNLFQIKKPFIRALLERVGGDNRVILMSTMKNGLGFGGIMNVSGNISEISFSKFIGDAFRLRIDYNNDGFTSAEESFYYAKKKIWPHAIMIFFAILLQIFLYFTTGFIAIPFPTIYDRVEGELPIVYI